MAESRRSVYRILYPIAMRPILRIGKTEYKVVDCSEGGVRYEYGHNAPPTVGSKVGGTLVMRHGAEVAVQGEVLQVRQGAVVILLKAPGIRFAEIMGEQRFLRAKVYRLTE